MPSPFPGMDPYVEACGLWEDFHQKLIAAIENVLSELIPERYVIRLGERSYVVLTPEDRDWWELVTYGDVAIPTSLGADSGSTCATRTTVAEPAHADLEPVTMRAFVAAEEREAFIEIRELSHEQRLVTRIGVPSPLNKRPDTSGWYHYQRVRQPCMEGGVANLVEIDLLRGGKRMPMWDEWPAGPYYLLVARKRKSPECEVWPAHFVQPLPEIRIPLQEPDPDLSLSLQPLIDAIYERSRYGRDIDYHQPCMPPLSQSDSEWLAARLTSS